MMNKNNSYCLITTTLLMGLSVVSTTMASSWVMRRFEPMPVEDYFSLNHIPRYFAASSNELTKANLIVSVVAPKTMSLVGERIIWTITALDGVQKGRVYNLRGLEQRAELAQGDYKVVLTIDGYQSSKTIQIEDKRQRQELFIADVGRIIAKANESVAWSIESLDGRDTLHLPEGSSLNVIVATGLYKVDASLKGLHRAERVRVTSGKQVVSNLFLPAGRVNLIATRGNAPLFKPTKWNIYRIENGERREVGQYNRHIQAVTMPPGHYEAVAKSEDIIRTREFWVGTGATNDVQVSMD